jgi:DNA-binding IclR family transcriptional regulator
MLRVEVDGVAKSSLTGQSTMLAKAASTVDRALSILHLFTLERPQWTVEDAARAMHLPTSTVYRYFRSLTSAGMIVNFTAGRYVIGPAIIELDRHMRRSDPLIVSAQPVMDRLARDCHMQAVTLLCRIYQLKVMCVDQRVNFPSELGSSYERGRPMPLFRGSASKVILAYLPSRLIKRAFERDAEAAHIAGFDQDRTAFKSEMRAIRRAGLCITHGEIDPGVIGISAPVFTSDGEIVASIGVVIHANAFDDRTSAELCDLVISGGTELTQLLTEAETRDKP